MTATGSIFPRSSFVGFDHLLKELDGITKHAGDHYPPHNIIKTGETQYLIELAVAGFRENEISVTVNDRSLAVEGEHVSQGREFIHRGISTKKFRRVFRLSEHVQVHGANLVDGILAIELEYVVPDEMRPRVIEISKNGDKPPNETDTRELLTENERVA